MGNKRGIKALHHALKNLTCSRTWRTLVTSKMCCIQQTVNQLSIHKNNKCFHTRNISGWLYSLRHQTIPLKVWTKRIHNYNNWSWSPAYNGLKKLQRISYLSIFTIQKYYALFLHPCLFVNRENGGETTLILNTSSSYPI